MYLIFWQSPPPPFLFACQPVEGGQIHRGHTPIMVYMKHTLVLPPPPPLPSAQQLFSTVRGNEYLGTTLQRPPPLRKSSPYAHAFVPLFGMITLVEVGLGLSINSKIHTKRIEEKKICCIMTPDLSCMVKFFDGS